MKPTIQTVYLPVKVEDDRTNIPSSVPKEKWGVHETHCCKKHGCKYGDEYCPVVLGHIKQVYKCEDGDFDNGCFEPEVHELQKKELFVFTQKQLNEYTANIIKQSLETAAEKSLLSINGILEKSNGPKYIVEQGNHYCETEIEISKESITNTFEETFKKFEV